MIALAILVIATSSRSLRPSAAKKLMMGRNVFAKAKKHRGAQTRFDRFQALVRKMNRKRAGEEEFYACLDAIPCDEDAGGYWVQGGQCCAANAETGECDAVEGFCEVVPARNGTTCPDSDELYDLQFCSGWCENGEKSWCSQVNGYQSCLGDVTCSGGGDDCEATEEQIKEYYTCLGDLSNKEEDEMTDSDWVAYLKCYYASYCKLCGCSETAEYCQDYKDGKLEEEMDEAIYDAMCQGVCEGSSTKPEYCPAEADAAPARAAAWLSWVAALAAACALAAT
jgi:hypothetical protein